MVIPLHSGWTHAALGLGGGHVVMTTGKGGLAGIFYLYGLYCEMGASVLQGSVW